VEFRIVPILAQPKGAEMLRGVALRQASTRLRWGDGEQTRSFLYIDEFMEGAVWLLGSVFPGPINIASEGRGIFRDQGVRGRTSDNRLAQQGAVLGAYTIPIYRTGIDLSTDRAAGRQGFALQRDHPIPGALQYTEASAGPSPASAVFP
jgi:hypothetical protein